MIEPIINHINARIESLNQFARIYNLCELVESKGKTYPAEYLGGGEFKDVNDFDFKKGVVYHRKTSDVSQEESEEFNMPRTFYDRIYSLRTVAVAPREIVEDSKYAGDKLADNIANVISDKHTASLANSLNALRANIQIDNISTDRKAILQSEYEGSKEVRYEFVYIAIDYQVLITASKECFKKHKC